MLLWNIEHNSIWTENLGSREYTLTVQVNIFSMSSETLQVYFKLGQ